MADNRPEKKPVYNIDAGNLGAGSVPEQATDKLNPPHFMTAEFSGEGVLGTLSSRTPSLKNSAVLKWGV